MELKQQVKGVVKFEFYRDGALYYKTEAGLLFPVPISDTGNATFLAEDKALLFMRYIRKQIAFLKESKELQARSSIGSEHLTTDQEVEGSNPSVPTSLEVL